MTLDELLERSFKNSKYVRGGVGRWMRGIEHRQKSTLFELACPVDNLSWFPCYFSWYILWSEHLRSNKVDFEAQKATIRAARRSLYVFYKSSQRFSQCLILYIPHCLRCLFSLCLSLETSLWDRGFVLGLAKHFVYVFAHVGVYCPTDSMCTYIMSCWLNVCKVAFDQLPVHVLSVSAVNDC